MRELGPTATPARFFDRVLEVPGLRFLLWLAFCALLLRGALAVDPHRVSGHYDEHYFFASDDIARISVVEYGQLPAWNPYFCGGAPFAANPQNQALSPDFVLRVLFGTGPGRRLAILLFVLLGLEGTYRLARRHGTSPLAATVAAIVFAASGRFFFMIQFGWINMFGWQLLPWAILGYERASKSLGSAVLGGGAIAWMLLNGGTYTVPFSVLALVALAIWDSGRALFGAPHAGVRLRDPWIGLMKMGLVTLGLSAAKLLPMLEIIRDHPRTWDQPSLVGPTGVLESLVLGHGRGGGDFASESYVGLGVVVLAIAPLFFFDRGVVKPLALAALFCTVAMGNMGLTSDVSLYGIIHLLPIYGQLRNPERFTVVVCLFLALAAGRGIMLLEGGPLEVALRFWRRVRPSRPWTPGRRARAVFGLIGGAAALGVGVAIALDLARENRVKTDLFVQDAPLAYAAPFAQSRGNRWDAQVWPRASLGTLLCFEENPFPQSGALRGDLEHDERAEDPTLARVERTAWSPNEISLAVDAKSPSLILVNQNWHASWRTNVGTIENSDGLLAIRVPAGAQTVTLRYRNTALHVGVFISLATVLALTALYIRRRLRPATD